MVDECCYFAAVEVGNVKSEVGRILCEAIKYGESVALAGRTFVEAAGFSHIWIGWVSWEWSRSTRFTWVSGGQLELHNLLMYWVQFPVSFLLLWSFDGRLFQICNQWSLRRLEMWLQRSLPSRMSRVALVVEARFLIIFLGIPINGIEKYNILLFLLFYRLLSISELIFIPFVHYLSYYYYYYYYYYY